jgi:pimeloyl-ACP methyl ester carboxylesterase
VAKLMDHPGLEKAIFIGHSMGGYVSLALALQYPGRTAILSLVATQAAVNTQERKVAHFVSIREVKQQEVCDLPEEQAEKLTSHPGLIQLVLQLILSNCPKGVIRSLNGLA